MLSFRGGNRLKIPNSREYVSKFLKTSSRSCVVAIDVHVTSGMSSSQEVVPHGPLHSQGYQGHSMKLGSRVDVDASVFRDIEIPCVVSQLKFQVKSENVEIGVSSVTTTGMDVRVMCIGLVDGGLRIK